MSSITTINASDVVRDSRAVINSNFTALNTDKVEGQSSSVDSEIALFSGTGGKTIKRASTTGILKATSGVIAAAVSATDYAPATTGSSVLKASSGGFANADASDITALVSAASLTVAGKVELATTAEINTGTDTTRAIPVDQFVASNRNVRYIYFAVVEYATDWPANGTTTQGGDLELPFTGTITEIGGFVSTAGVTGTAVVDVNLNGTTLMTSNKLSFDTGEKTTRTAATAPTLTTTAVTAGDIITVDIDTNHTTKAKGLVIRLGIRQT